MGKDLITNCIRPFLFAHLISAYHKEKDISIIMDSYGLFEKKWQFSADLINEDLRYLKYRI